MLVGVTGSIASGKSTFCNLLKEQGCLVVDCDEISHDVIKSGRVAYYEIIYEFGEEILKKNKEISRKKLGKIVFKDPSKLKKLEEIIHPKVLKEIKKYKKEPLVFVEVPLLFEAHWEKYFDRIVVVTTNFNTQIKRLTERNEISTDEAINLVLLQIPIKDKIARADYVIYNDGTNFELRKHAKDFLAEIVSEIKK